MGSRGFPRAWFRWLGHLGLCAVTVLCITACDRASTTSGSSTPATARAAAPSVYNTLAVIASPAVRESGLADIVAAELPKAVPGVRLVERERLDAATGELAAATLLGTDADAGAARLKLGPLVRADALLVLAEEEGAAARERAGERQCPPARRPRRLANFPAQVQLVIADCRQGARLRVMHLPVNARDPARLTGAVARAGPGRPRPLPGRASAGSSAPAPSFPATCCTTTTPTSAASPPCWTTRCRSSPAWRCWNRRRPARSPRNRRSATGDAGGRTHGPADRRGRVRGPPAGDRPHHRPGRGAIRTRTRRSASRSSSPTPAARTRRSSASCRWPTPASSSAQTCRPDILRLAPLPDQKPLPPEAQFKALAARADEFARILAFDQSTPLREAALLLNPSGGDGVGATKVARR